MMNNFKNNIRNIFERHGLENEQLELVVTDLFEDFKTHLMYDRDFMDSIKRSIEREERTKKMFR